MIKISFTDKTRESIIKEQTGKRLFLIEEQNYSTGNFLIFDITPQQKQVSELQVLEDRIVALETKVTQLEKMK